MSSAIEGIEKLAAVARARLAVGHPALVALDFDGTLTEIVDDPDAPALTPSRRRVLERVETPTRRLAIVSGRSLADVRARVGIETALYVGNHGLELAGPGLSPEDTATAEIAERLRALLVGIELPPGAFLEDKRLTATVHIRPREDARGHARVGHALRPVVEAAGFRLRPGKASWEIRPVEARDKGDALRTLIDHIPGASPATTLYVGDDITDEDAFGALRDGVTIRVGDTAVETEARYRLASPAETYVLLEILCAG